MNEYKPWLAIGVSEAKYWKDAYIEARKELGSPEARLAAGITLHRVALQLVAEMMDNKLTIDDVMMRLATGVEAYEKVLFPI